MTRIVDTCVHGHALTWQDSCLAEIDGKLHMACLVCHPEWRDAADAAKRRAVTYVRDQMRAVHRAWRT